MRLSPLYLILCVGKSCLMAPEYFCKCKGRARQALEYTNFSKLFSLKGLEFIRETGKHPGAVTL